MQKQKLIDEIGKAMRTIEQCAHILHCGRDTDNPIIKAESVRRALIQANVAYNSLCEISAKIYNEPKKGNE